MLMHKIKTDGINIVIGQEPNIKLSTVFACDQRQDAFIYVDRGQTITKCHRGKGFVAIETDRAVVVSAYFSPNGKIEDFGGMIGEMDDYISRSSFRKKL